ncbi:MAG: hypothetical protein ACI88A_003196 [Paraglaciecola sp.]|jgi:hypothetical protein
MKPCLSLVILVFFVGCSSTKLTVQDLEIVTVERVSLEQMSVDHSAFVANQKLKLEPLPSAWAIKVSFQSQYDIPNMNKEKYALEIHPYFCEQPNMEALLTLGDVFSKNVNVSPFGPISIDDDGYYRFYSYILTAHPWPNYHRRSQSSGEFIKFNFNSGQEDVCIRLKGTQGNILFNRYAISNEVKLKKSIIYKLANDS